MPISERCAYLSQLWGEFVINLTCSSEGAKLNDSRSSYPRTQKSLQCRVEAAQVQHHTRISEQEINRDFKQYASYLADYSKYSLHSSSELVEFLKYKQLLKTLESEQQAKIGAVPLGGVAKLSNPTAAFTFAREGCDSHHTVIPALPRFASEEQARQMMELYWQVLTCDVSFAEYKVDPLLQQGYSDLSRYGPSMALHLEKVIQVDTIFQADLPGCLKDSHQSYSYVALVKHSKPNMYSGSLTYPNNKA